MSMNLNIQSLTFMCLVLGIGRVRKHYEGGERTDKDELLNGKPFIVILRLFSQMASLAWG